MRPLLLLCATLLTTGCGSIDRIAFTVGYDKATVGIEADLRDPGKNPIGKRRPSGK